MYTLESFGATDRLFSYGEFEGTGCRVQHFILAEINWVTTDSDKAYKFIWFHCMRDVADKIRLGKVVGLQDLFLPCTGKGCLQMSVSPTTNTSLPMEPRQFIDAISAPCAVIICCWLSSPEVWISPASDTEQRQLGWEQCHLTLSRQVGEVPVRSSSCR